MGLNACRRELTQKLLEVLVGFDLGVGAEGAEHKTEQSSLPLANIKELSLSGFWGLLKVFTEFSLP